MKGAVQDYRQNDFFKIFTVELGYNGDINRIWSNNILYPQAIPKYRKILSQLCFGVRFVQLEKTPVAFIDEGFKIIH